MFPSKPNIIYGRFDYRPVPTLDYVVCPRGWNPEDRRRKPA